MQRFVAVGRLVRDLELKYSQSGTAIGRGRLAIPEGRRAQDGQELTTFVDIVLFGNQAEAVAPYARQGRLVGIEGRLQNRRWEGQDGKTRIATEIVVDRLQLLGGRPDGHKSGEATPEAQPAEEETADAGHGEGEDEESGTEVTAPF